MYLIKEQNYSLSGVSAMCDANKALHIEFAVNHRQGKFRPKRVKLVVNEDISLPTTPATFLSSNFYNIDIGLSALCRYSAYCPEAKPRLLALWNKHIGNYEDYKLRDLDKLGYLLCAIAFPQLADYKQDPFTFMLLCEAIIAPTSFCHFKQLVSLKRPDIVRVCLLNWCRTHKRSFSENEFPQLITKSVYRFCQRLVPHVPHGTSQQQGANDRAVGALIRIAKEPQLISRLEHMPVISANKLVSLKRYASLPYTDWLKLPENEAVVYDDEHGKSRLLEDIDGMTKELGASLKKLLKPVATVADITKLHDRLVAQVNEKHRRMHLAQLDDSNDHITDPMGDTPFPRCTLFTPDGIKHLNTANLLRKEGIENSHCVGGRFYIQQSREQKVFIFHVEHMNQHATLEINADTLKVLQLQGFKNSNPSNALITYVHNWLESEKQRLQLQAKVIR